MIIYNSDMTYVKPRNYVRNNLICSCLCPVISSGFIEYVLIKYSVEPNKALSPLIKKLKKNQWAMHQSWGSLIEVIELPKIFSKLTDEDYHLKTGFFMRDNIRMPFILDITIRNEIKYKTLKNQMARKQKLSKISFNE